MFRFRAQIKRKSALKYNLFFCHISQFSYTVSKKQIVLQRKTDFMFRFKAPNEAKISSKTQHIFFATFHNLAMLYLKKTDCITEKNLFYVQIQAPNKAKISSKIQG